MNARSQKFHARTTPEVVAGKIALEYAELDKREKSLSEESRRILGELKEVSAAKAEKLRLLTAGMNSDAPEANSKNDDDRDDKKESVYRLLVAKPSHIFPTAEVIKSLDLNRSTASVYLSELAKEGRIRRVKKGYYQSLPFGGAITTVSSTMPSIPATAGDALPERILALFESEPKTTFTALDICKRFGLSDPKDINAVRNALSRLARFDKIEKVSHGKYLALPGRQKM